MKVKDYLFHLANVRVPWVIYTLSVSESGSILNVAKKKEKMFGPIAGKRLNVSYAKLDFQGKFILMVQYWPKLWKCQRSKFRNLENQ